MNTTDFTAQNIRIAFLGGGAMAEAMIKGLLKADYHPDTLSAADPFEKQRLNLKDKYQIRVFSNNLEALQGAHAVILAVKPGVVIKVLAEIAPHLKPHVVVLSIAAGISLATLAAGLPPGQPLVRVMPNTPALVGAGISALLPAPNTGPDDRLLARCIMASVGLVEEIDNEALMDGITALSGSGPAYVYLIAEALSDGGVASGLPRGLADRLAVRTLLGAAKLMEETGLHPGVLKNQVTSPGGTTIAGLEPLEKAGVRGAFMAAVLAACQRSKELGS